MKALAKKSPAGGAPAPVASGGNAAAPAQAAPLPWRLIPGTNKRHPTRAVDARGCTVLVCRERMTRFDLANLELIVSAVNCRSIAELRGIGTHSRPEAAAPTFTIHHGDHDETVDARAAGGIGGA